MDLQKFGASSSSSSGDDHRQQPTAMYAQNVNYGPQTQIPTSYQSNVASQQPAQWTSSSDSTFSEQSYPSSSSHAFQASFQARPKKRSRPKRRPALSSHQGSTPFNASQNTQAESNSDDDDDEDGDQDSDDPAHYGYSVLPEDQFEISTSASSALSEQRQSTSDQARPPKKRPHLDHNDVGRFADMSIMEDSSPMADPAHSKPASSSRPFRPSPPSAVQSSNRPRGRTLERTPRSSSHISQPPAPPGSPVTSGCDHTNLMSLVAVPSSQELDPLDGTTPPSAEYDTPMATAKLPNSWEVDRFTTYVNSLDDDEEQAEDGQHASNREGRGIGTGSAKATMPITRQEAEELQAHRLDQSKSRSGAIQAGTHVSSYEVNPELLSKLEAHSRSVLIGGDMSRRRPSVPSAEEARNALILWKGPEELFAAPAKGGDDDGPDSSSTPKSSLAEVTSPSSDNVPYFAFGAAENQASLSPSFSPTFPASSGQGIAKRNFSGSSTSSSISSMNVSPSQSPRLSFNFSQSFGSHDAQKLHPASHTYQESGASGMDIDDT
ncbi:unnamed protein product [Sympodiomycopsis kandeliae]